MRDERIVRGISAALAMLAIAFVPLYLLFGIGFASACLTYGAGCAVVGVAVALLLGRRHAALQIPAAALPAAAFALVARPYLAGPGFVLYILMAAGALLAIWTERLTVTASVSPLKPVHLLAPLIALFVSGVLLWFTSREGGDTPVLWMMLIVFGAAWLAVAAVMLNRLGLRQAARAGNDADIPSGVRRSGMLGAVVLAAATFLLAGVGGIARFIGEVMKTLAYWAIVAFVFLTNLFMPKPTEEGSPPPAGPQEMLPMDKGDTSPLAELLSNLFIAIVLLAVAAAIGYGLYKLLPKLWKKLRERLGTMFATWREDEGYSDRAERLLSLRQALAGAGDRFRKIARRFRRRPRIGDFKTNGAKVRFLFREYLNKLLACGREPPPGATATEIAKPLPQLSRAYNRARYGEEEPTDQEIEAVRQAVER